MGNTLTVTPAAGRIGKLYYMKGDKPVPVKTNIDLGDVQGLNVVLENAKANYPTQALRLGVYRTKGGMRSLVETIDISSPGLAGTEEEAEETAPEPMNEAVSTRQARSAHAPALPAGLDNMTTYILQQTQQQLVEKEHLIHDLRDDKRALETTNRELEKKNAELNFDLRHKDKEHEFALKDAAAAQPKGLAGIGELANQLPPSVIEMIAAKFLGTPMPAPQQLGGGFPAGLSANHAAAVQQMVGFASESEENAGKLAYIVQACQLKFGGLDELVAYGQTHFPQFAPQ